MQDGLAIGILGGGQLGMMTSMAARAMGFRTAALDPDPNAPAMRAVDIAFPAEYTDAASAKGMAEECSVITYEFENIDPTVVEAVEEVCPVFPSSRVLRCTRHRIKEKEAVKGVAAEAGIAVEPYRSVHDFKSMEKAIEAIGVPAVLKTVTSGYDGKGQAVIRNLSAWRQAFESLYSKAVELVLEPFVPFHKEISVIVARDGRMDPPKKMFFPVAENIHKSGILDMTIAPARISGRIAERAKKAAGLIADALDVTGLLAVEMFLTENGEVLVNELAPRPHNSGHFTLDACRTSQFEQLTRILAGFPMGDVQQHSPAVMVNLMGELWLDHKQGEPNWAKALSYPGVSLHLYGKAEPRKGRKMGHITALANTVEEAEGNALEAREGAAECRSRAH